MRGEQGRLEEWVQFTWWRETEEREEIRAGRGGEDLT